MTLERNGIVPAPEPRSLKAWLLVADLRQSRADFQPRDCSGAVNAINVAARHIRSRRFFPAG
jgi:hypothetical protein